jgi:hypothetical protein
MAEANDNLPPSSEHFERIKQVSAQAIESVSRAETDRAVVIKREKRVFECKPEAAGAIYLPQKRPQRRRT